MNAILTCFNFMLFNKGKEVEAYLFEISQKKNFAGIGIQTRDLQTQSFFIIAILSLKALASSGLGWLGLLNQYSGGPGISCFSSVSVKPIACLSGGVVVHLIDDQAPTTEPGYRRQLVQVSKTSY